MSGSSLASAFVLGLCAFFLTTLIQLGVIDISKFIPNFDFNTVDTQTTVAMTDQNGWTITSEAP